MAKRKNKIIDGQLYYEFNRSKENFSQEELDRKLRSKSVRGYRRKTIKSGKMIEVKIYPIWDTKVENRGKGKLLSSEKQQKLNDKNRREHVNRLVHCNFGTGNLWLTVGYGSGKEPKDDKDAHRNIANYIRALKRVAEKEGIDLKYIYVTERSSKGRYHHHIICNLNDRDLAEKKWKWGKYPQARRIVEEDGSMEGLSQYISKEIKEKKHQKNYGWSKNLKQPIVTIADAAVGKRKAEKLAKNENDLLLYACKEYRADVVKHNVLYSEHCDGTYIYLRMIKKE